MIKEDHFACTTKMLEFKLSLDCSKDGILCSSHFSTPKRSDSHPRGHPTIHLSKSFRVLKRPQTIFHRLCRAFPDPIPVRGGGIIASATRLSTGVVRFAHVTFARRKRPWQPVPKASISKLLRMQRAVDNETLEFRHPSQSRPKNGFAKPSGLCRQVRRTSRASRQLFSASTRP